MTYRTLLTLVALASLSSLPNAARAAAIIENPSALPPREGASVAASGADAVGIRQLVETRQFDKALKEIEALEQKQPRNADIAVLKGSVYLAMNDPAKARSSFDQALAIKPDSAAAALHLGQLELRERNVDAARRRFEAVLVREPLNAEAMAGMAGVAAAGKREADYVSWLRKAIAAHPTLSWPRLMLAEYHVAKNQTREALSLVQEAQVAHPDDPRVLTMLGTVQSASGSKESAVRTFGNVVSLSANDPAAHWRLGAAQFAVNNLSAARTSASKALSLRPDYLEATVLLATVELNARQYGEALKVTRNLQLQHPKSAAGFSLEGDVHAAQKQHRSAIEAYEKALATEKSGLLVVKLQQALSAAGKPADGETRLAQWVNEHPKDAVVRLYFAETLARSGRRAPAIEQFQRVVKEHPRNAKALNNLAWLYYEEKDPRALATAKQAYELKRDDAQILDTLGWILVEAGQVREGLPHVEKAFAIAPGSPGIHYHRAAALAKSGDKLRARRELETLLAKHEKFAQRPQAEALLRQL